MNDVERNRIERVVAAFIEARRPPAHLRDKVDLGFRFDGRNLEIFEIRPHWNKPRQKAEESVAKARYVKTREEWWVFWQMSDFKWHRYDPKPAVKRVEAFLRLVDEDEYACFFG